MAEEAKRRMSIAKSALEKELSEIERRKDIQRQKIDSAFEQLYKEIEEKKREIQEHFRSKFASAEASILATFQST